MSDSKLSEADEIDPDDIEMCEYAVDVDLSVQPDGSFEVDSDGHMCVNEAEAKVTLQTHAGESMDFWLCDEHLKAELEDANVDQIVRYVEDE